MAWHFDVEHFIVMNNVYYSRGLNKWDTFDCFNLICIILVDIQR